jgi:hypothetical protein
LIGWNNRGKKTTPLRAADAARAVAAVDHALSLAVAPPLVLGPPTDQGRFFGLERDRGFWATISGAGPGYSFAELNGPRTGTAYEINTATVPAGTVVWLEPGYHGDATHRRDWRFAWQRFLVPCPHPNTVCFVLRRLDDLSPISGITVTIRDAHGGSIPGDCTGTVRATGTTDASGRFCWAGYAAHVHYDVCLSIPTSYGTCTKAVDFYEGDICTVEQTYDVCTGTLTFTVTDATTGSPVGGIPVGLVGDPSNGAGVGCSCGPTSFDVLTPWETATGVYAVHWCQVYGTGSTCEPPRHAWPDACNYEFRKAGYVSCCGTFSWSCDNPTVAVPVSLFPIEPDYTAPDSPGSVFGGVYVPGPKCCSGGCDPIAPNCGPGGRGLAKKVLRVKLHSADPNVFGVYDNVPIPVTWDGAASRWDSGCLASDGTVVYCGPPPYSPTRDYRSVRVLLTCYRNLSGQGATGTYTGYNGDGCVSVLDNLCPGALPHQKHIAFYTNSGSICAPTSASGVAYNADDTSHGPVGTVEVLE